jgi:ribosomal protein L3 glutamine methyltransferase
MNIAVAELITVRDWIRYAVSQMERHATVFGQGTDNAWDDAVFLVLRCLRLPIDQLDPFLDARLLPAERSQLADLLRQRCEEHVPTPYLVGEAWLQGHRFVVSRDVLIPRSPLSELIQTKLEPWIDPDRVSRVADICTGSGCLAILAALEYPNAEVHATDISEAAIQIAQTNIDDYGLASQVKLFKGDMLDALPEDTTYDVIICNPPYVNQQSMNRLPAEFKQEPALALAGGEDGMNLVRRLLKAAFDRLTPHGHLLLEIGHERGHFEAAFPELSALWLDTQATESQIMLLSAADLRP